MRGQVLGVDRETGDGQISGDDGQRYVFRPRDWSDSIGPAVGALIEFEADGTAARRIYRLHCAVATPLVAHPQPRGPHKYSRAVPSFMFGVPGLHRFYLRPPGSGLAIGSTVG